MVDKQPMQVPGTRDDAAGEAKRGAGGASGPGQSGGGAYPNPHAPDGGDRPDAAPDRD